MAIALTRGDDSRLAGAPNSDLPAYADTVESIAIAMLEKDDADGSLRFMGDINRARAVARDQVDAQLDAMRNRSAEAQARVTKDYGRRQQDRAQARGVDPETMPYGASASDVRLANRPVAEASAQLGMEQDAADRVVRGLREGTPTFEAQGDMDFLRERGDMNPLAGPGRTDMAMRGAIRERRGQYYEMPDGTRIPVGREPTAAEIRAEREWQDWVNSQPGSERQALYDPVAYEQHREGVRNDIRDRAREDMEYYGTGPDDNDRRARMGLPPITDDQRTRRADRAESENRVRQAQRGRFYKDKLMVDAGVASPTLGAGATVEELERAAFRSRYARRQAELAARKRERIDQAQLAGGQPTGGPRGTRATTTAINQLGPGWREIALLDRLSGGRVGGPTPLGVDQANLANAATLLRPALAGFLQEVNPGAAQDKQAQRQIELRRAAAVAKANGWDKKAAAREALEAQGASPAEIDMIMTDLFGPGWQQGAADMDRSVREAAAGAMEAPPPGI